MDHGNVYIRTELGEKELGNRDLTLELNEILSRIDGRSSVRDLMAGASFWSAETFDAAIEELLELGYIAPVTPAEEKIEEFEVVPEIAPAAVERQRITGKSKFSQTERTLISTVLFLDIVEYTRKSVADQFKIKGQFNRLLAELLQKIPEDDRIVIDTGDGAAIGFLADPEEVLHIAIRMRDALEANDHKDYPGLYVRMGINLGPVKLVTDMNGRENLIGDGVNDANRVMGFAKGDQILISRPFYDVVSRLSSEQQGLFSYQGIHRDKHRREHEIYEVAGGNRVRAEEENRREEKSEEQIRAERLDKMKAKLEAAARSEVESKAAMLAHEQARAAAEEEMRRKAAAARMAAEQTRVRKKIWKWRTEIRPDCARCLAGDPDRRAAFHPAGFRRQKRNLLDCGQDSGIGGCRNRPFFPAAYSQDHPEGSDRRSEPEDRENDRNPFPFRFESDAFRAHGGRQPRSGCSCEAS